MADDRDLGGAAERVLLGALIRRDGALARARFAARPSTAAGSPVDERRLLRLSVRQGLVPRVHAELAQLGLSGELTDDAARTLRTGHAEKWALGQRLAAELERLAPHVEELSPRTAVLGGPVLSQRLHGDPGRRGSELLTLLVPRADVARLLARLRRLRYQSFHPGPLTAQMLTRHGTVLVGNDVPLVLTWAVPGLGAGAREEVALRAEEHSCGRLAVRVPRLDDELLLVALSALHDLVLDAGRLRSLVDLADLVHAVDEERSGGWSGRVEHWRTLGCLPAVASLIALSQAVLDWPLPPELDASLAEAGSPPDLLASWIGVESLLPSCQGARRRAAWASVLPGDLPFGVRRSLARARTALGNGIDAATGRVRAVVEPRLDRARVDRDRAAGQTPYRRLPAPDRPGEVFVVLAAHRDPEAQLTIDDLFAKARHPERVSVGVLWQVDDEVDADCRLDPGPWSHRVRVRRVEAHRSLGVSWARYETQRLWRGEEYVLHIDSHSRFLAGWDEHLIDELAACPSPKPYLTGYPGAYRMGEPLPATAPISGLAPWEWFEGGVVRLYAVDRGPDRTAFVPTPFVAGGFSFARAELLAEVPYDPYLEYNEEEITLSLRLYTHGWDGFVAREGQLFHLYGMDKPRDQRFRTELGRRDRMTLWDRSLARYRHLVGLEHSTDPRVVAELEHFGLGRSRTLEEFEAVSGIQFWSQTSAAAAEVPEADDRPLAVVLPLGVPRDAARA